MSGLSRYEGIVKIWRDCQDMKDLSRYERFVKIWKVCKDKKGLSRYEEFVNICRKGLSRYEEIVKIWRVFFFQKIRIWKSQPLCILAVCIHVRIIQTLGRSERRLHSCSRICFCLQQRHQVHQRGDCLPTLFFGAHFSSHISLTWLLVQQPVLVCGRSQSGKWSHDF